MTACLVDSTVLVDYIRDALPAVAFLEALEKRPFLSVVSHMELYAGAKSRREEARIARLLDSFGSFDIDESIAGRAGKFLKHYRASHGIDDADALIAATAEHHGLKLATANVKHFPMFPKLKPAY
jgi:hypothetical protein